MISSLEPLAIIQRGLSLTSLSIYTLFTALKGYGLTKTKKGMNQPRCHCQSTLYAYIMYLIFTNRNTSCLVTILVSTLSASELKQFSSLIKSYTPMSDISPLLSKILLNKVRQMTTVHKGAFCQFSFRWIYYFHISKSTEKEAGKTHVCAVDNSCQICYSTLS